MAIDAERASGRVGEDDFRAGSCLLANEARERAMAGERLALHLRRAAASGASTCWARSAIHMFQHLFQLRLNGCSKPAAGTHHAGEVDG